MPMPEARLSGTTVPAAVVSRNAHRPESAAPSRPDRSSLGVLTRGRVRRCVQSNAQGDRHGGQAHRDFDSNSLSSGGLPARDSRDGVSSRCLAGCDLVLCPLDPRTAPRWRAYRGGRSPLSWRRRICVDGRDDAEGPRAHPNLCTADASRWGGPGSDPSGWGPRPGSARTGRAAGTDSWSTPRAARRRDPSPAKTGSSGATTPRRPWQPPAPAGTGRSR